MTVRIAVVSTHPIQYNAPAFRLLASEPGVEIMVFYEWTPGPEAIDSEFGRSIEWDIPLLDGYPHVVLPNVARRPGPDHFFGIRSPALIPAIRDWKPDVILIYGWSFVSHVHVLRAFHGRTPILFRGDSTLLDDRPTVRLLLRRLLLRWIYRHVDVALFTGARNKAYYREFGLSEEQLVWAPHAVDNSRFGADHDAREREALRWRERLGVPSDATVYLFAAKLSHRKAPDLMLEAFSQLRASQPEIPAHLVFVGDGEMRDALVNRAAGRTDVHFLGFQNQSVMPVVYRLGSVLVHPSRYGETWGLSVNEAMACRRGVIVSDRVGCATDLVIPHRNGLQFEAGSAASLSAAMRVVLGNQATLDAWGVEAARRIRDWSAERYARVMADVAKRMTGAAPSAGA